MVMMTEKTTKAMMSLVRTLPVAFLPRCLMRWVDDCKTSVRENLFFALPPLVAELFLGEAILNWNVLICCCST